MSIDIHKNIVIILSFFKWDLICIKLKHYTRDIGEIHLDRRVYDVIYHLIEGCNAIFGDAISGDAISGDSGDASSYSSALY